MLSESPKSLNSFLLTSIVLGLVSLIAISYELYYLVTDLPALINFNDTGYIFAIGYLFVILFHLSSFILVVIIRLYHKDLTLLNTSFILILGLISLFFIAVEKVMFDEVGREIYLEWPEPGEVYFIYAGLIINALYCFTMIIFSLIIIKREKLLSNNERDWFWS